MDWTETALPDDLMYSAESRGATELTEYACEITTQAIRDFRVVKSTDQNFSCGN